MAPDNLRYVLVWSGWLRLSHALTAAGTLFLLFSAWALDASPADAAFWRDWHVMVGQLLCLALLLRAVLLFVPGGGHWRSFSPMRLQPGAMGQMLKFYLTLGRFPLPNWYAHNPLWLAIYPWLLLILVACCMLGFAVDGDALVMGTSARRLHAGLGQVIGWLSLAHVVTVLMQDWKGKGATVSAMLNGYRLFHVEPGTQTAPPSAKAKDIHVIPISSIKRRAPGK